MFKVIVLLSVFVVYTMAFTAEELGLPSAGGDKPKVEHNLIKLNTFGTLLLDSLMWEKVMPNNQAHTLVMIANKGYIGNAVHDKLRDEYIDLAKNSASQNDLLFTQILINGAENSILAMNTFGMENPARIKNPYFFLFRKGEDVPIALQTPATVATLKISDIAYFVTKNTGVSFGLVGTDIAMDALADRFMSEMATVEDRAKLLDQAKAIVTKAKSDDTRETTITNLNFYTTIMTKIAEKGDKYADMERDRLQAILESDKVSESRKTEFRHRVNILGAFSPPEPLVIPGGGAIKVGNDGSPLE